jgi:acyl dehydratase
VIRPHGIDGLREVEGTHLGYSDWLEVTQARIDQFAEATGDHQWIHVDVDRAAAESPFGGTIAHGYLTLSLIPALLPQVVEMTGFSMGVNYGCNRVRFMSPVPAGARIRLGVELKSVEEITGGVQVTHQITFEVEHTDKPACVADVVFRSYV